MPDLTCCWSQRIWAFNAAIFASGVLAFWSARTSFAGIVVRAFISAPKAAAAFALVARLRGVNRASGNSTLLTRVSFPPENVAEPSP
jgi:hypothetical protein